MRVPGRFLVGDGRVVDAVRGRRAAVRLARARGGRARAAERRRQRLRDPLRRRLRPVRAARARRTTDSRSSGPASNRSKASATRRRSSTTARCWRPPAPSGSRRGSASTTSRSPGWFTEVGEGGFVDDHAGRTSGPATSPSARRRSATSRSGGSRSTSRWPTRRSTPRAECRSARSTGAGLRRYGATLLAQRDAWRELRGGSGPVATIHNLVPLFALAEDPETHRWHDVADEITWRIWIRRRPRRRPRAPGTGRT